VVSIGWGTHWDELLTQAMFYYMAVDQFEAIDMHLFVKIGDEISSSALALYDAYVHENEYPPQLKNEVK
jgi:hypothetical protein